MMIPDPAGWTHVGYGKINYVDEEPDQEDLAALRSWTTQPRTVTVTGNLVLPRSRDDDHE